MPIVSGMGGNAGTQTLAVVVRAIATNQLTSSNTWWMIMRELRIALTNGLSLGLLIGTGTGLIFGNPHLGMVIAAAMIINNLVAGLAGILVPVRLDRLRVDPAVSSAVFVTTATDTMGFFSFLGLAVVTGLAPDPTEDCLPCPCNMTKWPMARSRWPKCTNGSPRWPPWRRRRPPDHAQLPAPPCRDDRRLAVLDPQAPAGRPLGNPRFRGSRRRTHRHPDLHPPDRCRPCPRRAHQGWRYLEEADAPADLDEGQEGDILPPTWPENLPAWVWSRPRGQIRICDAPLGN
jgi:hypothetical protein